MNIFTNLKNIKKPYLLLFVLSSASLVFIMTSVRENTNQKSNQIPNSTPTPTIVLYSPESENIKDQINTDYRNSRITAQEIKDNPFITSFPIITDQYTIIIDFQKTNLRVIMNRFVKRVDIQKEVEEKIKEIGVNTKEYPIVYLNFNDPAP